MERKRITLHPVLDDGTVDTNVNLYPKTFLDGIVDREGNEVEVALKEELPTNYVTTDTEQTISGHKLFSSSLIAGANSFSNCAMISGGENPHVTLMKDTMNYMHYGLDRISGCINGAGLNCSLNFPTKSGTIALTSDVEANKGTKLYKHHFDVVLTNADLPSIPQGTNVSINVNALSTSGTSWQTLSELDGGGFIVSAFGTIPNNFSYIFELKLFYASLGNGTLLLNIHDLTTNTVKAVAITTVGGGQSPNTFALQDSTTPL